jgi:uncharacterized protein YgbK (DUF1537 family)
MVVAQPLDSDADAVSDARVVSINTDSRHLEPAAAAEQVERCVRHFSGQRFDIVFKKIDSTLRGNVASETMVLMNVCQRKVALIAPAFPAQGRTVVNGLVHVDGVPLAQTGFANDALSPPPLQPLGDLFAEFVGTEHIDEWRHGEPLKFPDEGVIVADAGSDDDMSEIYSKVSGHVAQTLLVGSAGLGLILARSLSAAPDNAQPQETETGSDIEPDSTKPISIEPALIEPATIEPIVFVVGSRATRSREQVEKLRIRADTIVLEAPNGRLAAVPNLSAARQVVVLAVADPEAGNADSVDVARQLADAGIGIANDIEAGAIVVTGGDTAIAVLAASKCAVIQVAGNLMPGIPYARFGQNGRPIFLVTKAGGFGTPDTMVDIVRRLRGGAAPDSPEGLTT